MFWKYQEYIDINKSLKEASIATAVRMGYHTKSEDFSNYVDRLYKKTGQPIYKQYVGKEIIGDNSAIAKEDPFDPRRHLPEPNAIGKLRSILGLNGK